MIMSEMKTVAAEPQHTEKVVETIDAATMLADIDVREDRFGQRRIFSCKIVTGDGKLYFIPQAYACGLNRMNMKKQRFRGVQPCDCKGNDEGHPYPVKITNFLEYNGKRVTWD